jgi:hypothetical protein
MSDSVWKIQDKDWMKQRQERWKGIQLQLKHIIDYAPFFKADVLYHKAYFLKGSVLPIDEKWAKTRYVWPKKFGIDENSYGKPFHFNVYFRVWYHPEVDESLFKVWCEHANVDEMHHYCLGRLSFSHEAEFFADRSIYLDQFWAPKTYQELLDLDKRACPKAKSWISEKHALELQLNRLFTGVRAYKSSVSWSHLANHVSDNFIMCFAFPLLKDLLSIKKILSPELVEKLIFIMNSLVNNETPPESYAWGMATKLYRELTEFFESGVTPEVDALWQKAKLEKANNPT